MANPGYQEATSADGDVMHLRDIETAVRELADAWNEPTVFMGREVVSLWREQGFDLRVELR